MKNCRRNFGNFFLPKRKRHNTKNYFFQFFFEFNCNDAAALRISISPTFVHQHKIDEKEGGCTAPKIPRKKMASRSNLSHRPGICIVNIYAREPRHFYYSHAAARNSHRAPLSLYRAVALRHFGLFVAAFNIHHHTKKKTRCDLGTHNTLLDFSFLTFLTRTNQTTYHFCDYERKKPHRLFTVFTIVCEKL